MIDRPLIDEEYLHLGGSKGFIEAVKNGPDFLHGSFHEQAMSLYRMWSCPPESRGEAYPTLPDDAPFFLPHLAIICLAWTIDSDDIEPNAFYDRLGLIVPDHNLDHNQLLARWAPLWSALESWTAELKGKRGFFEVECLGHMTHVGKPRAQVILTPTRLKNLPEFFVTTGLATLHEDIDDSKLVSVILDNEGKSRTAIGNLLYNEILDDSEIGRAGVTRMLELLKDPDFRTIEEANSSSYRGHLQNSRDPSPFKLQLRLILECVQQPVGWICRYGVLGATPPETNQNQPGWNLRPVDLALGGLWLAGSEHTGTSFINALKCGKPLFESFSLPITCIAEASEDQVELHYPSRSIHVFPPEHWFGGNRLVEGDNLPSAGACYLLITAPAQVGFQVWLKKFEAFGGQVTDYTRSGLPEMTSLLYLKNLEFITEYLRQSFPERSIIKPDHRTTLFFRGGSRLPAIGAQRVYLPYDPPDLVFAGPEDVCIVTKGATLVEIPQAMGRPPKDLPGVPTRQFRIDLEHEVTQVEFVTSSKESGWCPERLAIGIGRDAALGASFDEDLLPRFDQFGGRIDELGILGPWIDYNTEGQTPAGVRWDFEESDRDRGRPVQEADLDHPAWQLCESLSLKPRITSQEFRRRAEKILKWWPKHAWAEARWLRALCHVEVERDNRGRLAYVYRVTAHGFLLPWKSDGNWMVVIGGCPNRRQLATLINAVKIVDVGLFTKERTNRLTPPRWLLMASSLDAIELALDEANIKYAVTRSQDGNPIPLCLETALWGGGLDERLKSLRWIDGVAPEGEKEFSPSLLRMTSNQFHCPRKLIVMTDVRSNNQNWNILEDAGLVGIRSRRYAFLLDPCWGKWNSTFTIAGDMKLAEKVARVQNTEEHFPLPADEAGSLHVPASLVFPTILARALLTASGLSPSIVRSDPFYSIDTSPFIPNPEYPYLGACRLYESVPRPIAELICGKVGAYPVPVRDALA